MWIIGIALGIIMIISGVVVKNKNAKIILIALGGVILFLSLIYGALVILLLGGID